MNRIVQTIFSAGLLAIPALAEDTPEPYAKIAIAPVLSQMITREQADRVYSGQIKSQAGRAEFEKAYGITLPQQNVDFTKQMLIFGITDNITTRAVQFLKQERMRSYILDYADTGIEYRLRRVGEGLEYSHLQVFLLDRIDGMSHIKVKNHVENGLSRMYDKEDHNIERVSTPT